MKKNKWAKIFAVLALLGIIVSIVWTGILFLTHQSNAPETRTITQEELQDLIDSQSASSEAITETQSWSSN